MNEVKSAQSRATRKYDAKNTKLITMKLNLKTDADILAHLDKQDNKQGYIKKLIRNDITGVITKKLISGEFLEGQSVIVEIDGREFKRKVWYSSKWKDLVITVLGNEYAKYEFNA